MDARRFAVVLCAAAAALGCQNNTATAPQGEELPQLVAERVMYGVEFYSNSDGVKRARTHADTAYAFNRSDSTVMQLRGLNVQMFEEDGRKSATLTSRRGSVNTQTKAMIATGNVVLVTQQGKKVLTEELHYDPTTHRVWSTVFTTVVNADGSKQTMKTFTTDDKFRSLQATGAKGATGIKF
jgi:LPS export ABC transporter protein LptC